MKREDDDANWANKGTVCESAPCRAAVTVPLSLDEDATFWYTMRDADEFIVKQFVTNNSHLKIWASSLCHISRNSFEAGLTAESEMKWNPRKQKGEFLDRVAKAGGALQNGSIIEAGDEDQEVEMEL
ncbi:hypothetical protein PIB30_090657, partial [Stylosanthes scabra]|nr:hypothetical protein [Stylosanthes scabra]